MPYRPWPRFSGCMKAGHPFIILSAIAENFVFEKFELRFFKNIHDLFTRISGPHSSTNFFTITAERLAGEVRKPITLECKKLHHLRTIYEFNHQFGRNHQTSPIHFCTNWRPKSAEIDPSPSEFAPFRLKSQEPSKRRSYNNQGSIVRIFTLRPP